MANTRLTSKGQVTIPKEVREHLSLHPGDQVQFVVLNNGTVIVQPAYIDISELAGTLSKVERGRRTLSVDEMNEVIRKRGGVNHDRN